MSSKVVPETHRSQGKLQVGGNQGLNHASRMGQRHRPQWPRAWCRGPCPCQAGGWSQWAVVTQSCGPVCADKRRLVSCVGSV